MNGYDIYMRANSLLGYNTCKDNTSASHHLLSFAFTAVCQICADLCIKTPQSITDEISANVKALEALPYGVAMMLASSHGDTDANRFFAELYNGKRAAAKAGSSSVKDVLPVDSGGTV
ncbi:MAG: hypothetical protein E7562_00690 [Ruminococcaceae bacterium]|nr:hypothetical protein [Oscillospiraceae bacterium]